MRGAVLATLEHPAWWAMALAAFLVRGGIVVILLPIVAFPTTASLVTTFAPPLEALVLGRPSLEAVVIGTLLIGAALLGLIVAALTGTWLDLALVREAAEDEDLDLGWRPVDASIAGALGIRLLAHAPTLLALAYGAARIVGATYDELIAPGDLGIPIAIRVAARAPDAVALLAVTWLVGETIGPLAARWHAAGLPLGAAFRRSVRHLLSGRGILTFLATNLPVLLVALPFTAAIGGAWLNLVDYLHQDIDAVSLGAAVLLLAASWALGLGVLGAALAWRATGWTAVMASRLRAGVQRGPSESATEAATASSVT